jgi:UDP-3-O-[3-hydroxymyristoyl] glucosamine N-acyltransferase
VSLKKPWALTDSNFAREVDMTGAFDPRAERWSRILIHPRADVGPNVVLVAGVVVSSGSTVALEVGISAWSMPNVNIKAGRAARIGHLCMIDLQAVLWGNAHRGCNARWGVSGRLDDCRIAKERRFGRYRWSRLTSNPEAPLWAPRARPIRRSED